MNLHSLKSRLVGNSLPNPLNDFRLSRLKNRHRGKRAFILGNGPSLKTGDLDRLKGEITFASNRIFLAYDQTDWRPTYYTLADEIVARNNQERIGAGGLGDAMVFAASVFQYFRGNRKILFANFSTEEGERNWDPVAGVRAGNSVINFGLKMAFFMGIREVYVIGCDHSFEDKSKRTGEIVAGNEVIVSVGEKNHFHPDYRKAGENWTVPQMELIERDFAAAAERYHAAGGEIYNASRITKLDTWPKVSFDDVVA